MSSNETEKPEHTAPAPAERVEPESGHAPGDAPDKAKQTPQIAISLKSLAVGAVIAVLVAVVGVLTWLYIGESNKVSAEARADEKRTQAEDAALDYAVNAAQMDYQDLEQWKIELVNGTSPELNDKLTTAAGSIQEILTPLQWKSSARPLAAKVRSESGGIYVVDAFVSVLTKTMQAPDGLQSTATYSVTLDSNNDWQITDVGGVDAALGK
ncbi:hypothetical protein H7I53_03920 [Mycolicibacterium pulveris]|uniref:Mce-associated membrane protein n=1 Tax=Mycolicibacterium pulveris TaxID=36813 RepID=A0A7I7UII6_MYCPV|nr:hypothetical protein [Mycolicibacterium pulveris]MCV6979375.1 hypothetical protein [Mycolicibacterium pulveris]BBY81182.1 hypothetical protein MPUL_23400 [Mycolicibacterium pulveris]